MRIWYRCVPAGTRESTGLQVSITRCVGGVEVAGVHWREHVLAQVCSGGPRHVQSAEQVSACLTRGVFWAGCVSLSGLPLGVGRCVLGCGRCAHRCAPGPCRYGWGCAAKRSDGVYAPDSCVPELVMQECRAGGCVLQVTGAAEWAWVCTGMYVAGNTGVWELVGTVGRPLVGK